MSAKSIRDRVKAVDDRAEKIVDVPEWDDVKLLLISPTSRERSTMMASYTETDDDGARVLNVPKMMPTLVVFCAHDPENRERAFQDADADWLADKNGAVVERIGMECMVLAGFAQPGDEGPADAGKDDSSMTPNDVTESDSPVISAGR